MPRQSSGAASSCSDISDASSCHVPRIDSPSPLIENDPSGRNCAENAPNTSGTFGMVTDWPRRRADDITADASSTLITNFFIVVEAGLGSWLWRVAETRLATGLQ